MTTKTRQPQLEANGDTPEFCLLAVKREPWGEAEIYFHAGVLDKRGADFLTLNGSQREWKRSQYYLTTEVGTTTTPVRLYRNCLNGYWHGVFEGSLGQLGDILLAVQGRWQG